MSAVFDAQYLVSVDKNSKGQHISHFKGIYVGEPVLLSIMIKGPNLEKTQTFHWLKELYTVIAKLAERSSPSWLIKKKSKAFSTQLCLFTLSYH